MDSIQHLHERQTKDFSKWKDTPNQGGMEGSRSGSEPAGQVGVSSGRDAAAGGLQCGGGQLNFASQEERVSAAGGRTQG